MNWYYAIEDTQVGPVTQAEFDSLLSAGTISGDTRVWNAGMANWTRYADWQAQLAGPPAGEGIHKCAECGGYFPETEMISFENARVCAGCKPIFIQKLKEGVTLPTEMLYAGFWIRFWASFIDFIIQEIVGFIAGILLGLIMGAAGAREYILPMGTALGWIISGIYFIWFNGRFGATPGKMALRIKIVRADGRPISFALATGRFFARVLSMIIIFIGCMMAGWDEQKRALHDMICDTRVIRY